MGSINSHRQTGRNNRLCNNITDGKYGKTKPKDKRKINRVVRAKNKIQNRKEIEAEISAFFNGEMELQCKKKQI